MEKLLAALILVVLTLGLAAAALAANTDAVTVNYAVTAINGVNLTGTSVDLTVVASTAGAQPAQASDATCKYDITTNSSTGTKLYGKLDAAMPSHVTLKANLTAPTSSGTSRNAVILTASDAELVYGITTLNQSNIGITFTLDATVAALRATLSRTFTLTLAD